MAVVGLWDLNPRVVGRILNTISENIRLSEMNCFGLVSESKRKLNIIQGL
jgi:hypothetical protein